MPATSLGKLASLIRSKNAGPFWITFDILFELDKDFQKAAQSKAINLDWIAATWNIEKQDILLMTLPAARAIKFSFPRQRAQGNLGESDQYSGQQYAPLLNLMIQ